MTTYADIINKKKKEWDAPDLMDGAERKRGSKIPFSSPQLNYSTYGGIPRNAITEFFGPPSGGKSSTAVDICKNAYKIFTEEHQERIDELHQRIGNEDKKNKSLQNELEELVEIGPKKVLYLDLEHSFDMEWADKLGIADGSIDIMQPPNIVAEDLLQAIQDLVETDEVGLIVIDSIPSLVTKKELDKTLGEATVAPLAGLLTTFCRKIIPLLTRYNTTLLVINQTRDNLNNPYVQNTPGGQALKFYCSLRMEFKLDSPVDFLGNALPQKSENPAGYIVTARIVKQKTAPYDRKNGSYYLMAQSGIRLDMDYAQLAIKHYGIIKQAGAWYTICDPVTSEPMEVGDKIVKVNGMAAVFEYLQNNPEYYDKLKTFIYNDIIGGGLEDNQNSEPVEVDEYE